MATKRAVVTGALGLGIAGAWFSHHFEGKSEATVEADRRQITQLDMRIQADNTAAEKAAHQHRSAETKHLLGEVAALQAQTDSLQSDMVERGHEAGSYRDVCLFDAAGVVAASLLLIAKRSREQH